MRDDFKSAWIAVLYCMFSITRKRLVLQTSTQLQPVPTQNKPDLITELTTPSPHKPSDLYTLSHHPHNA